MFTQLNQKPLNYCIASKNSEDIQKSEANYMNPMNQVGKRFSWRGSKRKNQSCYELDKKSAWNISPKKIGKIDKVRIYELLIP